MLRAMLFNIKSICYQWKLKYVIAGSGIILQRFPEKDWSDTPFIDGIEWVSYRLLYFLLLNISGGTI